jgi:hypothetical protein
MPAADTPQGSAVAAKLKAALIESSTKLGAAGQVSQLSAWQQRLFDEEALPQYQRFVKNYRSAQTHSGTAVSNLVIDIDVDSLRNYLRFYAPLTLGRSVGNAPVLMYLRGEPACTKCQNAAPILKGLAQARVERRGLSPIWLTNEDLGPGGAELEGKALEEKISELATARNAAATLVMLWGLAPADDVDTAHADEIHYGLRTRLEARGLAGTGTPAQALASAKAPISAKTEGFVTLLETDSFESYAAKLLADAFVELGAASQQAEIAQASRGSSEAEDKELRLDVSGVKDFAQYSHLKAQLGAKFPSASLEERLISRSHVVLALVGELAELDTIKSRLSGLKLEEGHGRLALAPGGPQPASATVTSIAVPPAVINLEIRP